MQNHAYRDVRQGAVTNSLVRLWVFFRIEGEKRKKQFPAQSSGPSRRANMFQNRPALCTKVNNKKAVMIPKGEQHHASIMCVACKRRRAIFGSRLRRERDHRTSQTCQVIFFIRFILCGIFYRPGARRGHRPRLNGNFQPVVSSEQVDFLTCLPTRTSFSVYFLRFTA